MPPDMKGNTVSLCSVLRLFVLCVLIPIERKIHLFWGSGKIGTKTQNLNCTLRKSWKQNIHAGKSLWVRFALYSWKNSVCEWEGTCPTSSHQSRDEPDGLTAPLLTAPCYTWGCSLYFGGSCFWRDLLAVLVFPPTQPGLPWNFPTYLNFASVLTT